MKIYNKKVNVRLEELNLCGVDFDIKNSIFFDIETTGFSPASSLLYMIGCLYYDNGEFFVKQFFLDNVGDEAILIGNFFEFASRYGYLIHFNGNGFDIPYIIGKCRLLNIPCDFSGFKNIDIYKESLILKNIIKLKNHKQKTLEEFIGLKREDPYTGGELINVYKAFLLDRDDIKLSMLLLHNTDDLKHMPYLLKLFDYTGFFKGRYDINSAAPNDTRTEFRICLNLTCSFDTPVTCTYGDYRLNVFENSAKITIKIYSGELKYFYPNYKDYYYLPGENITVHKSVAFYVDKNYRTKAKAADCYSRKSGCFLPQYENIISPYFKRDYNDKITYFEMPDDFIADGDTARNYINHILHVFCKKLPV